MIEKKEIQDKLDLYGVKFCPHSLSRKMGIVSFFANAIGYKNFKETYWLTLGNTIFHPSHINPFNPQWQDVIAHELVHVEQQKKTGIFLWVLHYLYSGRFRYEAEREAYLKSIEYGMSVDEAIDSLLTYRIPANREMIESWLVERLAEKSGVIV